MKRAVLYLCYTSSEQAKELAPSQYNYAEKYCAENGIEIIRVFDEISVKPPLERYYFDKALKVAKHSANDLTYFLIIECSHISNKYLEFKEIQKELRNHEIYILSIHSDSTQFGMDLFENEKTEK